MDAIKKALAAFSDKERARVKEILGALASNTTGGLDVRKLKGREDIFRVRKGDIRIIYRKKDRKIFILSIERRSEKTYKFH